VSQGNTLPTEGFLAFVFCSTISLLSLLLMRLIYRLKRLYCPDVYKEAGLTARVKKKEQLDITF
jgi:hypothetical protein